ncbi:nucleotide exchange factor GrpE, partial [Candidatus Peregrinibacteria bacterium]|nr:nucleotide exchange factor GrpE [Candidatus Peregrinibacteria bacterium]
MTNNWDSTSHDEDQKKDDNHFDSATPQDDQKKDDGDGQNGSDDLKILQQELEESKTKLAELTRISQQALADLQNYKKRVEEEKNQFAKFANSKLIQEILPTLDNFSLAVQHIPE